MDGLNHSTDKLQFSQMDEMRKEASERSTYVANLVE
jgi:hypothetical protein